MSVKTVSTTIKGISPILMNAYPMVQDENISKRPMEDQAEYCAYRDKSTGRLYIPGMNIQRCLVAAATYSKGKGRASLQKPVAACVMVTPEYCDLGVTEYIIDSRRVVIPATKGSVIKHRPRLNDWSVSFNLEYDDDLLTEAQLRRVVDDAGLRVGLLDFRPEKKGPFGRFMVTLWKS